MHDPSDSLGKGENCNEREYKFVWFINLMHY